MTVTFEEPGWSQYKVNWYEPHRQVEPLEQEIAVVDAALDTLVQARILPDAAL